MSMRDRGLVAFTVFNLAMIVYQMFFNPYTYDWGYMFRVILAIIVSSVLAGIVFFVAGLLGD